MKLEKLEILQLKTREFCPIGEIRTEKIRALLFNPATLHTTEGDLDICVLAYVDADIKFGMPFIVKDREVIKGMKSKMDSIIKDTKDDIFSKKVYQDLCKGRSLSYGLIDTDVLITSSLGTRLVPAKSDFILSLCHSKIDEVLFNSNEINNPDKGFEILDIFLTSRGTHDIIKSFLKVLSNLKKGKHITLSHVTANNVSGSTLEKGKKYKVIDKKENRVRIEEDKYEIWYSMSRFTIESNLKITVDSLSEVILLDELFFSHLLGINANPSIDCYPLRAFIDVYRNYLQCSSNVLSTIKILKTALEITEKEEDVNKKELKTGLTEEPIIQEPATAWVGFNDPGPENEQAMPDPSIGF